MKNRIFNFKLWLVMIVLNFNLFSDSLLDQIFEKKLKFEDKPYSPKELFEVLSNQLDIKFIYKGENNYTIVLKEFKDRPAKILFSSFENRIFDFQLKFDENDRPYIIAKESNSFKETSGRVKQKGESIGIEIYESSIKDILKELEKVYNKKFVIENKSILEKKTSLKIKDVKFEELLKKLSEEIGFNYAIENDKVRIW